jgi:hypothetical protein
MNDKPKRGGRRPNQTGRPPKPPDELLVPITIKVTPKQRDRLKALPNQSEFIRAAVDVAFQQQTFSAGGGTK